MESWVSFFDIFLNSSCPETEASIWLQQSFNPSSNITTNSFLSLLTKPSNAIVVNSSSSSNPQSPTQNTKRVMWIRTLPNAVQARILSFLACDHMRFCSRRLSNLARDVLSDGEEVEFWVKRAARQLLDRVSDSSYEWVSGFNLNLDSEEEQINNDFESVPEWLKIAATNDDLLLPWLPISTNEINIRVPFCSNEDAEDPMLVVEEDKKEYSNNNGTGIDNTRPKTDPLDPEIVKTATSLKTRVLNFETTSKSVELANEIRQICVRGVDSLAVLSIIEPWKVDDETASILISHLVDGAEEEEELAWPSYVLCSIALPKLLCLKEPASRVLVTATIEYCKLHQRSAVYALLFPLIFVTDGINNPISDVMVKIMKVSLHPAHVSSFCQKVLCGGEDETRFICLPCHKSLISDQMVWTESVFYLFYNILNHNVHFTQDSVDRLVHNVVESVDRFSKSLKFGNFLLCLVNKCGPLLKYHKALLIEAVGRTNTLVTKTILAKLSTL